MRVYNIIEYGAVPDGKTNCTKAIQRAIDLCGKGEKVYVPKGDFITGAVFLKSNMILYIEEGGRLIGSGNSEDFPIMSYPFEGINQLCYASLLNTDGAPYENSDTKWFRGAIYADGFYGYDEFDEDTPEEISEETPEVDGLYFKDITIETIGGNAIYLYGLPERPFKNVYLENVNTQGKYGMKTKNIINLQLINVDVRELK